MKIIVTSSGADLDAATHSLFGRCPMYVFVDTDDLSFQAVENPAIAAPGGAGVQAAQFVLQQGARAVVTGNVGPNAYQVFESAGIPVYLHEGGTVREAVEAYRAGRLTAVGGASAAEHSGMGKSGAAAAQPGTASRAEEIAALQKTAGDLRQQLAQVMERLDRLEKNA
ncbi:MAG: NifB/NifX family molybdenum-iron cluster-binding protein [Thermoflexales bacterium]|nr:NifB/NifX family molybdenum-iron cluster-binding protein [Thermoflexales bacterium]